MSHNTYAESFSQTGYYGWKTSYMYYGVSAAQQTNWVTSQHDGYGMYFGGPNGTIGRLDADIYGNVPANSIISFNVSVCADTGVSWAGFSGSAQWFLIDHATTAQDGSCFTEHYRFYNTSVQTTIALTGANGFIGSGNFQRIDFTGISWATLASGTDYSSDLGQLRTELNNLNTNSAIINDNINNVNNNINNINNDVKQDTQDAADDAQSGADDAQADSEAATSSLLSVITGFFGAMANLNPTNCKFDSHLPFLSGNGQIDLCTVPAPAVVQAIGSLILIGLMVPFAIHMYNRFISITGSFQK